MQRIDLDSAATTPVLPEVWEAMRAVPPGNPASAHGTGRRARQALEDARERTAELLGAFPDEVIFTSGATEANNLAVFGLAGDPPGHVVVSAVEHPCVTEPVRQLAGHGFAVDELPVDGEGVARVAALPGLVRPDTRLVSVQLVNHETGAIQPVEALTAQGLQTVGLALHCDAAQAVGKLPVNFHALGVTALTVSAHKFHGPPGVGAILLRRGTKLRPLFFGGHQQQGRRPGTEPVTLAVGLATALELAEHDRAATTSHVRRLAGYFLDRLRAEAAPVVRNGLADPERSVPHVLNLSFPGCAADALLMALDLAGVAASAGSACSSGSLLPSPVLRAMGVPDDRLRSALRFSFARTTTEVEVEEAAARVAAAVRRHRSLAGATGEGD